MHTVIFKEDNLKENAFPQRRRIKNAEILNSERGKTGGFTLKESNIFLEVS
jgi:hypothetical protein